MRGNKTFTNLSGALVLDDREKHVPRVADCYLFYDDNRPQGTCFKPHFIDRLVFQLATGINISVKLNSRAVIKNYLYRYNLLVHPVLIYTMAKLTAVLFDR